MIMNGMNTVFIVYERRAYTVCTECSLFIGEEKKVFLKPYPLFLKYHKQVNLVKFKHHDPSSSRATRGLKNDQ